mgnify:FL=1
MRINIGQQVKQNKIMSPCVGICQIDEKSQLCIGCFRSANEIAIWPQIDYEKASEIISQISKRSKSKK